MQTKTLKHLFVEELAEAYDAEHRLSKAFVPMVRAATHPELRLMLQSDRHESESHIRTIEKVFNSFGEKPKARKCGATVGLLKESKAAARRNKGQPTINAALISIGQKMKHYEIATFGCLVEWAAVLNNREAVRLLSEILDDDKAADQKLTRLARALCNQAAKHGSTIGSRNAVLRP